MRTSAYLLTSTKLRERENIMGDMISVLIEVDRLNHMRNLIKELTATDEYLEVLRLNKFEHGARSTLKFERLLRKEYTSRLGEFRDYLKVIEPYWEHHRLDETLRREASGDVYADLAY